MKKLLLALLAIGSMAYAADDCSQKAQTVVSRMHDHNVKVVQLNYSPDQAAEANTCIAAIAALDKSIIVNKKSVSGNGVVKFEKQPNS